MTTGYNIAKRLWLGVFVLILTSVPAFAQTDNISSILQAGKEDANILVRAYLKPFGNGFGAGLNTGWTNTAKTHKPLGFDLSLTAGLAVIPDADLAFDVTEIGLTELQYESGPQMSQTINGEDITGSTLAAYASFENPSGGTETVKFLEFTMPEGTGFKYVPAPMIKAGIGLIKGTDIMVRYLPEYEVDKYGSFELWGIGAKHDIKQWLPGGKLLPIDLSVMVGYTKMDLSTDFRLAAEDVIRDPNNTENPYASSTWDGQGVRLSTEAYTVNALVGKTLPMISIYGGVGYEVSTLNILTPGSYPTVIPNQEYESDPNNNEPFIVNAVEEPINVEIDGENKFHALAGFRLRFAVFHISGSYTMAKYSSYNLGFGISFR